MLIDLTTIVVLSLGGLAVYIAYKKPELGIALGLGTVIITLLVLLLQEGQGEGQDPRGSGQNVVDSGEVCKRPSAKKTG
ncbi:hypothetical protein ACIBCS_43390 [Streptomyces phaeochromogenes]|uniref:hypothetical protein n=1 Tax=Streptomyces phaeochromogenes TaxID=1923 RepID=UPI0033CEB072